MPSPYLFHLKERLNISKDSPQNDVESFGDTGAQTNKSNKDALIPSCLKRKGGYDEKKPLININSLVN